MSARYNPFERVSTNRYLLPTEARAAVSSAIAHSRATGFNAELETKMIFEENINNLMAELNAPTPSNGFSF